jgi:hypothetical protein
MPNFIDLTGQRFGQLTVQKRVTNSKSGAARWLCKCQCGTFTLVSTTNLRSGNSKSCGCGWIKGWQAANARKFIDLTGRQFGRLKVIEKAFVRKKETYWKCLCACRNEMIINGKSLKRGLTKSCGCLQREITGAVRKIAVQSAPRLKGRFVKSG